MAECLSVFRYAVSIPPGGRQHPWLSRWAQCKGGHIRPVLNHGPRSVACVPVLGEHPREHNESEGGLMGSRGTGPLMLGAASTDHLGGRCPWKGFLVVQGIDSTPIKKDFPPRQVDGIRNGLAQPHTSTCFSIVTLCIAIFHTTYRPR